MIATCRRSIAAAARVPSLDTASEVGFDVRGSRIEASTENVAESMTSIAPGRAAYRRRPSALTANALGAPAGGEGDRARRPRERGGPDRRARRQVEAAPPHARRDVAARAVRGRRRRAR